MAGKHRKSYDALHSNPVRANIAWNDAVAMAEAFGVRVIPSGGSLFTFVLNGVSAVIHRPHPGGESSKPMARSFRAFLDQAGVDRDDL